MQTVMTSLFQEKRWPENEESTKVYKPAVGGSDYTGRNQWTANWTLEKNGQHRCVSFAQYHNVVSMLIDNGI